MTRTIERVTVVCDLSIDDLVQQEACQAAMMWLEDNNYTDLAIAWQECERADWMLRLLRQLTRDHRLIVQILCALVRRTTDTDARVWNTQTHERFLRVIEIAEAWVTGAVSDEEVLADDAAVAFIRAANWASYTADTVAARKVQANIVREYVTLVTEEKPHD